MLRNLRWRMTAMMLGLSVGPLLLTGIVLLLRSFDVQHQQAIELEREVAHHIADQLDTFIKTHEAELRARGDIPGIQNLDTVEQQHLISTLLNAPGSYETLLLLDATGQEYAHISHRYVVTPDDYRDWSGMPEFTIPATRNETYYGPIWFEPAIGEPLITLAVPFIDRATGELECVLVVDLRFKAVWGLIADFQAHSGEDVYVVNADGQVVAHRNPSVVLAETRFEVPEDAGSHRGLHNDRVILASHTVPIGTQTLTVVAERRETEALALAYDLQAIVIVTLAAVFVLTSATGLWAVRQITRPIQQLAATAQAISAGDLSRRSTISRQDEIGHLAKAFDSMTVQLQQTLKDREQHIAEQERTAHALRDSEARYRGLFEDSPISLWEEDFSAVKTYIDALHAEGITDCAAYFDAHPDSLAHCARLIRVVSVNQSTLNLLRMDARTAFDTGLEVLFDRNALDIFRQQLCALTSGETHFKAETTQRTMTGDIIEIELNLAIAPGYEDTWERVLVSIIDITERKLVEQRRLDLAVEHERVEILQRVLTDASHDLRTPLTTIKTHLYLLEHLTDPDKLHRTMRILDTQVRRLEQLLNDMLSAARAQRGREPIRQIVHIDTLIQQIIAENSASMARKHQTLDYTHVPDTPVLWADAERLQHAIGSVIVNALHFSPPGGAVTVRVAHDDTHVTIDVQDSGTGISEDVLPHIFEPFFRGDEARSSETGGAGLGLTIAKHIIEAHSGTIEVQSTTGEGTVFRIMLPTHSRTDT